MGRFRTSMDELIAMIHEADQGIISLERRLAALRAHRHRLVNRLTMRVQRKGWQQVARVVAKKTL